MYKLYKLYPVMATKTFTAVSLEEATHFYREIRWDRLN